MMENAPERGRTGVVATSELPSFSLLGGPLHRIGARLGLVRNHTNTVRLGLAIGGTLWSIAVVLANAGRP